VRDNLCKVAPRPPLLVVQVHDEGVSPKGHEFEPLSARTLYTCGSVAGRSRVRGSVRYITHDSCAISVVPPFNMNTDFCITEDFFFTEKVFARIFYFVIVMMTMMMLRKAVRLIS